MQCFSGGLHEVESSASCAATLVLPPSALHGDRPGILPPAIAVGVFADHATVWRSRGRCGAHHAIACRVRPHAGRCTAWYAAEHQDDAGDQRSFSRRPWSWLLGVSPDVLISLPPRFSFPASSSLPSTCLFDAASELVARAELDLPGTGECVGDQARAGDTTGGGENVALAGNGEVWTVRDVENLTA